MSSDKELARSALTLVQRFVGTSPDALKQMRSQIEVELQTAEMALKRAQAQLRAIDLLEGMIADEPAVVAEVPTIRVKPVAAPSLRKAIKQVLSENGGFMNRDEIVGELQRRNWAPGGKTPRNTVVSRLSEMTKAGILRREGDAYALTQQEVPAT